MPRIEGHRAGAKTVRTIVEESRRLGIRYLTLFAFSTENWNRPAEEVSTLMKLFYSHLASELELMLKNDIRLRAIGDLSRLPNTVQQELLRVAEATSQNRGMDLILAVSYGSRTEILHAAKQLAVAVKSGKITDLEKVSEKDFANYLYTAEIPDPDLLIRTSNENRISNFLLWQLAYTEIVVSPLLWPEFSVAEYHRCLQEYAKRERRYGLTDEQITTEDQQSVRAGNEQ
jgi:undecaprenyl diphosphate synthase